MALMFVTLVPRYLFCRYHSYRKAIASRTGYRGVVIRGRPLRSCDNLALLLGYWSMVSVDKWKSGEACVTIPDGAAPLVVGPASEAAKRPGSLVVHMGALQFQMKDRSLQEITFAGLATFQVGGRLMQALGCQMPAMRVCGVVVPRLPWLEGKPLLLTRRVMRGIVGTYNLMWVFPGGSAGVSESPLAAAARELTEETGLFVRPEKMKLLGVYQAEAKFINSFLMIYAADAEEGPIVMEPTEVAQSAFLPTAAARRLLAGDLGGTIDGLQCGASAGEATDIRVPLAELQLGTFKTKRDSPCLGGAHWYALERYLATEDTQK
eukprot:NODE_13429_length_1166_cov_7.640038.p1 GENE.NODE_13429_length_1166_cov_7.640038~~NODE_13429_length_1166_cov_7.640038.p1  ORF type:complete len:352 (-),score=88.42 NODE_13429_length_1166_cov_7.640038:109-1071(-)